MRAHWVLGLAAAIGLSTSLQAGEIRVISSVGVRTAVEELAPQFERASGHKLTLKFGTTVPLMREIAAGETFDVVILTPPLIADLVTQGKIAAATSAIVAKAGLGVAVRAGAPKPDISTPEAFKRTLLGAKSIVYSKEGASGTSMERLVERLGISAELQPRTLRETRSGHTAIAVAEGKAEIGFTLVSEILPVKEATYVGPLPPELQSYIVFAAAVSSNARDGEAARAFIRFLMDPAALPVLKAKGLEPG